MMGCFIGGHMILLGTHRGMLWLLQVILMEIEDAFSASVLKILPKKEKESIKLLHYPMTFPAWCLTLLSTSYLTHSK